jgi:hypothetical protein
LGNHTPEEVIRRIQAITEKAKQWENMLGPYEEMLAQVTGETARKRNQKCDAEHPVFGRTVRTDATELLGFRKFPHLRQFVVSDARALKSLNQKQRKLVENWSDPTPGLTAICRNGSIYSALRNLGVFELNVEVAADEFPTPPQEAAFLYFAAHEKKICSGVINALLRYYHFVRQEMPDAFDYLDDDEKPHKPNAAHFARLIQFDGVTVCQGTANGMSPLLFGWDPVWDPEHKLQSLLFRDQVIMMDAEAYRLLGDKPRSFLKEIEKYGWNRQHMNEKEKLALEEFVKCFKPVAQAED